MYSLLDEYASFKYYKESYYPFLYTAIIIEPRKHKALHFVIQNICENLSSDWEVVICHGLENKEFVQDILTLLPNYQTRFRLHELPHENITIDQYNEILKSTLFYDAIRTEPFLLFQTDSMIFSQHKDKINKFLEYDYVGAPWKHCPPVKHCNGNGGFSLRKKSKMVDIINLYPSYPSENEDIYFSRHAEHKPTYEDALEFSVETVYHKESFGCHKCWVHLSQDEMNLMRNSYNDLYQLEMFNK